MRSLNSLYIPLRVQSVADCSVHSKRGIERLKQSRVAKRLEQALYGALFEQLADGRCHPRER